MMKEGDVLRLLAVVASAGVGALLALVAAEVTGNLGGITTVEQFVPQPVAASSAGGAVSDLGTALSVERIYRLDAPGVVEISTPASSPRAAPRLLGSGFVIDKAGHILTSSNVIGLARDVEVSFSGDDEMGAHVVGADPGTGIAVLSVDARPRALTPLPLCDSCNVAVGDPVVAIGNPLSSTRTATAGIVSAVQRSVDAEGSASVLGHGIETDAAIDRGNAGGPLIDASGQVIGINAAPTTAELAQGLTGLGFAIPIDDVKSAVAQLIKYGRVRYPFLGIEAVPVTVDLARLYNLPSSSGLLVQAVEVGSAASRAGLRAGSTAVVVAGESYRLGGDIIVAADGVPILDEAQLRDILEALTPGDRLRLEIWRTDKEETVYVKLGKPPG
ncbi:MAG: S1C family serine protease [Acidimicrobiales bacterium]